MEYRPIAEQKGIALVAHDSKKNALSQWAHYNRHALQGHRLFATGTTGRVLEAELDLKIKKLQSGPLGGDQQLGALIVDGQIDLFIFFWDPLAAQPHDPDVKALLRVAVLWNIPVACNRATADMIISSPLFSESYEREVPDYQGYVDRPLSET